MFYRYTNGVHRHQALSAWSILESGKSLIFPGEVENVSPDQIVGKLPFSFSIEPDGLLLASIVPQHVDSGHYTVLWIIAGNHSFYYRDEFPRLTKPGTLISFYDGHPHSLMPAGYDVYLPWAGFYWDFKSPKAAFQFFNRIKEAL